MKKQRTTTNKKDFDLFVKECKRWIKILELNRYDIIYEHKSSRGEKWCQAANQIYTDSHAVIYFDTEWTVEPITPENIKIAAKHEVIHLLLGGMKNCIYSRFINEDQVTLSEEEVVRILCKTL